MSEAQMGARGGAAPNWGHGPLPPFGATTFIPYCLATYQ